MVRGAVPFSHLKRSVWQSSEATTANSNTALHCSVLAASERNLHLCKENNRTANGPCIWGPRLISTVVNIVKV